MPPRASQNNTGRCTNSNPNPQYKAWVSENPNTSVKLCPHLKTVPCTCSAFVNANNPRFPNKCTCNHDNSAHMSS
ncbi:hypothetical protein C8A01DRAFT_14415 [Parachaetomium inaequale]|uniref:Uncharacterized protein n=1 Tax=Parachaetomium inaequale TaxID=2588326 RepID=A0AAN6PN66_9PEZI|nr:hypothetical protein C8A01DRAFT_14415 [Parachaetomium inaequale]